MGFGFVEFKTEDDAQYAIKVSTPSCLHLDRAPLVRARAPSRAVCRGALRRSST